MLQIVAGQRNTECASERWLQKTFINVWGLIHPNISILYRISVSNILFRQYIYIHLLIKYYRVYIHIGMPNNVFINNKML